MSYSSHVVGDGDLVFAMASEQKLEGIMSKRARHSIAGGAVDDAQPTADDGWRYIGRVGSGFSDAQLRELSRKPATGGSIEPTIAHTTGALKDAKWIEPTVVAEVHYRGDRQPGPAAAAEPKRYG